MPAQSASARFLAYLMYGFAVLFLLVHAVLLLLGGTMQMFLLLGLPATVMLTIIGTILLHKSKKEM